MRKPKCEMFVCRYLSTCLVGADCENGHGAPCRLNYCEVCSLRKKCKNESAYRCSEDAQ